MLDYCDSLTDIYYSGTKSDWDDITIEINNEDITEANIHCSVLCGDIDDDGVVNLKDATLVRRFYVGGWDTAFDPIIADVNADGVVNLKDATLIRRYYVGGWGVEFR